MHVLPLLVAIFYPVHALRLSTPSHVWRRAPFTMTVDNSGVERRSALAVGGLSVAALLSPAAAVATDLSKYTTTKTGLKYLITQEGEGEMPQRGQRVTTDYTLWLNDFESDKKIDSSKGAIKVFQRGTIGFSFFANTGSVVPAWDEAVMGMRVGEVRRLIVPPELGYGDAGAGKALLGGIPGGATLYFELELKSMDKMQEFNEEQKKWLAEHPGVV